MSVVAQSRLAPVVLKPGSPEARAALDRFIAGSCNYWYYRDRERCTERAVWPPDEPRYCCKEHARKAGKASTFNAYEGPDRPPSGIDEIANL